MLEKLKSDRSSTLQGAPLHDSGTRAVELKDGQAATSPDAYSCTLSQNELFSLRRSPPHGHIVAQKSWKSSSVDVNVTRGQRPPARPLARRIAFAMPVHNGQPYSSQVGNGQQPQMTFFRPPFRLSRQWAGVVSHGAW